MQAAWAAVPYQTGIGISKDGRIIWSPIAGGNQTFGYCDVDVCNGAFVNGYYSYISTYFSPYIQGCYGPGSNPAFSQ